jgi:ABC-type microcin C transport system duplicated ATPase subunit YejF
MSVADTVKEPMRSGKLNEEETSRSVNAVLKRVGLGKTSPKMKAGDLSPLDRRRLQIARALSAAPQLLVLYEPLLHLDVLSQALILDLLRDYRARENVSFLLVTADFAVAQALCDQALVIRERLVVESGPMAELIAAPSSAYTGQLLRAKAASHLSLTSP